MDRTRYPLGIYLVTLAREFPDPLAIYQADELAQARAGLDELANSGIDGFTLGYRLRGADGHEIEFRPYRPAAEDTP